MIHRKWQAAVAEISRRTRPVTDQQYTLARFAGIDLPNDIPAIVAGARLQSALTEALGLPPPSPITATQEYVLESQHEAGGFPLPSPLNSLEAQAWINFFWLRQRQVALEQLQLEAGDVVKIARAQVDLVYEVASIGDNGRVHFKGGLGRSTWPDRLTLVCRRGDSSKTAVRARQRAKNEAAKIAKTNQWSIAKQAELAAFQVLGGVTDDDLDVLRETVEVAKDEKPIQALVQRRPQLLTALLGGATRYLLPQVRLGATFVADFLIADVDSRGVRWIFVELETPRARGTLKTNNDLDKFARKGVSQIKEWREWIANNLPTARQFRAQNGSGLPDIRSESDGLVLVGRRTGLFDNSSAIRQRLREESRIDVRTYDWWIEQLQGTLSHAGLPASSPYVLSRVDDSDDPW